MVLHWVQAHVGHELNEWADRAAKFGTMSRWDYHVPLAWTYIKGELRSQSMKTWARRWREERTCRQTRLFLPTPSSQSQNYLLNLPRKELSLMIQCITGHNYLQYHLSHTRGSANTCRKCGEEKETAWHLVMECQALARERLFHLGFTQGPPQMRHLQYFIKSTGLTRLFLHPDATD